MTEIPAPPGGTLFKPVTQLPEATLPLLGTERVMLTQSGQSVQASVTNLTSVSANLSTPSYVVVGATPDILSNARTAVAANGVQIIDAGAGTTITWSLTGQALQLNQVTGTGALVRDDAGITARSISGDVNNISISNPSFSGGSPVISVADNPAFGGTAGMNIPGGTTAQRPVTPGTGRVRYNASTNEYEAYYPSVGWQTFANATASSDFSVYVAGSLVGTQPGINFSSIDLELVGTVSGVAQYVTVALSLSSSVSLSGKTLIGGTWSGGTLVGPTLSGGTLSGVTVVGNSTWSGGTLVGPTLSGGTLIGATFSGGTISGITDLAVADGGTGASTAAGARSNLSAAALGANTDITSLSGLTGAVATPNHVDFDVTPTTGGAVGRLIWNTDDGTLNLGMIGGNVTQQIGEESYVYARNNTGSTLLNGKVVKVTGSIGTRTTVALAQSNSSANAVNTIGMLTEDIANNAEGFVTTFGLVRDLDTSGFTEGAIVYLSPTTAGDVTETKPSGTNHVVRVGFVVRSHPTLGSFLIDVHQEPAIQSLTDVTLSSLANNDLLKYNSSTSNWANVSGPSGAIVGTTDTQTLTNKTISGGWVNNATVNGPTVSGGSLLASTLSSVTILGSSTFSGGTVTGATLNGVVVVGNSTWSGGTLNNVTINGPTVSGGSLLASTLSGATILGNSTFSGGTVTGATVVGYASLTASGTFTRAQRGTISSGTISGTVALDFGNYQNFELTANGNPTFTGPSGTVSGQSGTIEVIWAGGSTWSFVTGFQWPGGTAGTPTGTSGSKDVLAYLVTATGAIAINLVMADTK